MISRFTTDTHPLIWYLKGSKLLGSKAKDILDKANSGRAEIVIPTICLLEAIAVAEKGRLDPEKIDDFIKTITLSPFFLVRNLDLEVVVKARSLKFTKDLHDRIVVSVALIERTPLISKDTEIKKSRLVKTVWD